MSTPELKNQDLTDKQRERLVDMYVRFLDEGQLGEIQSILEIAQKDSILSDMIAEINKGMADEAGFKDSPEDRAYAKRRLKEVLNSQYHEEPYAPNKSERSDTAQPGSFENEDSSDDRLTFVQLACERTGKRPTTIAEELNASVAFLDDINNYSYQTPRPVLSHLAKLQKKQFGIPEEDTWRALEHRPNKRMAASRDESYDHEAPTFEEMIGRSGMSDSRKHYWMEVASK